MQRFLTRERLMTYGALAAFGLFALILAYSASRPAEEVPVPSPADTALGQYNDRVGMGTGEAPAPAAKPIAGKEFGTWIWEPVRTQPAGYAERMLSAASSYGMNAVYLTVDDYLEIDALPAGAEKDAEKAAYMDELAGFVSLAKARGIAVDAEGGARDWSAPENRYKGYALVAFVGEYNRLHPEARLRGLQYDVESYLLPWYEDDKESALLEYAEFIDESARRMALTGAAFSVVVPHFYDSAQAWTPAVTYEGKTAHAFTHVLDALRRAPGSSIIVMAYRDFLDGEDGTLQLASAEMAEAAGSGTRIIVAQEMGNVDPGYVTFYGSSKGEALAALSGIAAAFAASPAYGGVAVHYLDPFLELP